LRGGQTITVTLQKALLVRAIVVVVVVVSVMLVGLVAVARGGGTWVERKKMDVYLMQTVRNGNCMIVIA
jgi:hypothetical protein